MLKVKQHIFLSGGFGESPYLRAQVGEFARLRQIQLRKPEDAWLAVALGAVIKGIEEGSDLTSTGACRRHYGVSTSQPFSSFKHDESDAYIDPFDGEKKAGKQMTWLIRKGDPISSTEPKVAAMEICRKFGRGDSRVFKSTIVACEDSYAPERMADLHAGRHNLLYVRGNANEPTFRWDCVLSDYLRSQPTTRQRFQSVSNRPKRGILLFCYSQD